VKTAADHESERRVLSVIREAYPEHAITAEESDERPGEGYRWDRPARQHQQLRRRHPHVRRRGDCLPVPRTKRSWGWRRHLESGGPEPVATAVAVPVLEDLYVVMRVAASSTTAKRPT
jgi:hypothetical protein